MNKAVFGGLGMTAYFDSEAATGFEQGNERRINATALTMFRQLTGYGRTGRISPVDLSDYAPEVADEIEQRAHNLLADYHSGKIGLL
jgi:hypothetical protein